MAHGLGDALIVGGTGMLAGASAWMAARAAHLVLAARHPEALAERIGARAHRLDWSTRDTALPDGPFDIAVSWLHRGGLWLVPEIENRLRAGGRSIRIHPSSSRDPAALAARDGAAPGGIRRQNVVLWRNADGSWLSHEQISAGVIRAVREPVHDTLVIGAG